MALTAGTLRFTLEYGKGLKDRDWIGRQDPYARLQCGAQTMRSRTHIDGGKNPVWNQTFSFNIINENSVEVELWDEDTLSRDDKIGRCTVSLAKVRQMGTDSQQVNVMCQKSRKVHGFISVTMTFTPNHAAAAYTPQGSFAPYGVSPPPYQYQPSMPYPAAPAQAPYYGAAPSYHPPPAPAPAPYPAYAPPAPAPYAPPAAPAPYPSAPAAYPAPGAPPAPAAGGYYPSLPTQQQFYPGASVPAYTTPPPIHFG